MNSSSPLAIPDPVQQANQTFLRARRQLAPRILRCAPGLEVATRLRDATDRWICTLFQQAVPEQYRRATALFATGGYGRNELAFHSDIDVLIAIDDPDIGDHSDFALGIERLMAWSRHTRLAVSHAVRSSAQLTAMVDDDPRSAIALLDMRRLHGGSEPEGPFHRHWIIDRLRDDDRGRTFVAQLIERHRRRIARNGETVYLLEPDVKNGEGGLRDLNSLAWAAQVRWQLDARNTSDPTVHWPSSVRDSYRQHLNELLALRNRMHLLRDRKHDRLSFRLQQALVSLDDAPIPAEPDDALRLAGRVLSEASGSPEEHQGDTDALHDRIETMMSRYYRRARRIAIRSERLLRHWAAPDETSARDHGPFRIQGQSLDLNDDEELNNNRIFEMLETAAELDLLLDPRAEARIERHVSNWPTGDDIPASLAERLRNLLVDLHQPPRTSRRLLDLGIVTATIPEFRPLICHVQHDLYHVYTTDVHSRKCLEQGRTLLTTPPEDHDWPAFCSIGNDIEDTTVFLLACLFHDIGKNRGGDHADVGADMMPSIGARLQLGPARRRRLEFLVRHHLALSTTARRRDISDPEVIGELADRIGDVECLNQLTALTFCDISTVGPDVLNDWTASLLLQLHARLRAALTDSPPAASTHGFSDRHQLRIRLADALANTDADSQRLDHFVNTLPVDHLRYTDVDVMLRQFLTYFRAFDSVDDVAVTSTPLPDRSVTEVVVSAPDTPGTLARIAGAIASVGLNIMTADVVTTDDARTLDTFFVAHFNPRAVPPAKPRPVDDPRRIDRLETRITDALCDRIDVDELLRQRRSEQRLAPRHVPTVRTNVERADTPSSHSTVIEVRTPDRLGLLHTIASTLHDCRVDTRLSRIDSLGHQAIDTFYVSELDGDPLSEQRTQQVIEALQQSLHD